MLKLEEPSSFPENSSGVAPPKFYQNLPTHFDEAPKVYYGDIHQNIFPCDECPKSYNQLDNLRRHQRTHSGFKLLNCRFCERKFHRADGLKGHTLNQHKDQEDYQNAFYCGKCEKSFATHWELSKHINSVHEHNNNRTRRTKPKLVHIDSADIKPIVPGNDPIYTNSQPLLFPAPYSSNAPPPLANFAPGSSSYPTPSSQRSRSSPNSSTPVFPSVPVPAPTSPVSSSNNFPMRAQFLSFQNQPNSAPPPTQALFGFPQLPPFPKESLQNLPERPPISFPAWHPRAYRN